MTSEQFAYWLQGFSEISGKAPTEQEWEVIKDHLKTVFFKITPTYTPTAPLKPQFCQLTVLKNYANLTIRATQLVAST